MSDFDVVRAWIERKVPCDRDEALAALARIEAELLQELRSAHKNIEMRIYEAGRHRHEIDALRADRLALAERVREACAVEVSRYSACMAGDSCERRHAERGLKCLDIAPLLETPK